MIKKVSVLIILIILSLSCQSETEKFEFTFFRWSIHEDYYLRFNSSDTLYLIINNPILKQTKFTLLDKTEKEKIHEIVSNFKFPKKEYFSSSVDDGLTYAFTVKTKHHLKRISIHENSGPKEFWIIGEYIESLKRNHDFKTISKVVNLDDMNNLIRITPPPTFNIKDQ